MRFTAFATSCVAVASYAGMALAASLEAPTEASDMYTYDALTLPQLLIDAEVYTDIGADVDADADAEAEGIFKNVYHYFRPPKTEFFDEPKEDAQKQPRQDQLLSAMEDIIYEIVTKETHWENNKGKLDQYGKPHDYCSFSKHKA